MQSICELTEKCIQVHIKIVIEDPDSPMINKEIYEIVMTYPIGERLTNLNAYLARYGFAECTHNSILNEEHLSSRLIAKGIVQGYGTSPKQRSLNEAAFSLDLNKYAKKPSDSQCCKILNVISPDEIWLQVFDDANGAYDGFVFIQSKAMQ